MAKKRSSEADASAYESHRAAVAVRDRRLSEAAREIGPLPAVANPRRKARCKKSLERFCKVYLADRFPLNWSPAHLLALERLQTCVLQGGQYAFAMARASGKTSLAEAAALWALLYGYRAFVVLLGATEAAAGELMDSLRVTLETNDLLAEDFPEVCHPIRSLEGISHRARGQTLGGERTRIGWTAGELVLPTVPGSKASGSLVRVAGITGRVRGMKATLANGKTIRPDLVIVDDPQTDDSAVSPVQNATRERLLSGAVLGLAGPKNRIAAVVPCTVIAPGDLADRILDRDRHPEWQGERTKLLITPPTNERLWEEYARVRAEGMRNGQGPTAAIDFYAANREAMDAGAEVSWPERYLPHQISALQYAMDLKIDDPVAFASEYQNEPLPVGPLSDVDDLEPDEVCTRLDRRPRGTVPREATRLTAAIDIQARCLFWCVVGWQEDYGGGLVDCGCFPPQNRAYFSAADARPTLEDLYPGLAESARLYAALEALVADLIARPFEREGGGGAAVHVERLLIDANWGASTDVVYQLCRRSPHSSLLLPSHGRGIGASMIPMRDWPRRPGERAGRDWRIAPPAQGRGRHVTFDANSWKTFLVERLRTPAGSPGALWIWGSHPREHQLLADHFCSEYRVRTMGRGREVDEWRLRPNMRDNHWLDTCVLAAVAASVQGLVWSAADAGGIGPAQPQQAKAPPRPRRKLSEMREERRRQAH